MRVLQTQRRMARAEAAAWIVRLHGPRRSPELEAGFRAWLAADAENARQFERVTEVWDTGAAIALSGQPRLARWPHTPPRRWMLAAAATVLVVCGLSSWGVYRFWLSPAYTTGIGEQRVVRLEDGSRVSLNSGTRIEVAYRDAERRVRLERGEAYFEVAKHPARPFVVVAGDRQVRALGTAFLVRYEPHRTAVTLLEGRVAVRSPEAGAEVAAFTPAGSPAPAESASAAPVESQRRSEPEVRRQQDAHGTSHRAPPAAGGLPQVMTGDGAIILAPGQRLTFVDGSAPALDEPHIEAVTAWRRGEVVLDRTTLAEAVVEMNRYDEVPLLIEEPAVAQLRISGIYHTGDNAGFARTIARLYGLQELHRPTGIHLRSNPELPP